MQYLTPEIFEGKDGWLFLAGGTNQILEFFSRDREAVDSTLKAWSGLLRSRKARAAQLGARYFHVIVPDKLNTYREEAELVDMVLRFPAEELERDAATFGISDLIIPLTDYFRRQKQRYPMFWRTDTHYTIQGCYSAYQMICAHLKIPARSDLIYRPSSKVETALDLGGKLDPVRTEQLAVGRFALDTDRTYANELVTIRERKLVSNNVGLHTGSMVSYDNRSASAADLHLLVFGDSFFEYRTHLLTGMFAETVRKFTFVWSTSIDWSIVAELKPDVLLTECAERFMTALPGDTMNVADHVKQKLAPLNLAGPQQRAEDQI
jgi:alginate O-acetyltransferase complex protein AlgJ